MNVVTVHSLTFGNVHYPMKNNCILKKIFSASLRSSHSAKNRTSPQVMVAKKLSNERRPSQSSLERSVVRKASQQGKHSDKVATPAGKFTSKSNVVYTDPENRVGTRNGRTPKLQPSR